MTTSHAEVLGAVETALWLACDHLLMYHTNPWELDEALVVWGFETGPCEAQDHIGLDHVLRRYKGRGSPILSRMVNEGRLGKMGGVGYYRYPGGGGAVVDPLIEDMILEEAWFAKVQRRPLTDAQIIHSVTEALHGAIADNPSADVSMLSGRLRVRR